MTQHLFPGHWRQKLMLHTPGQLVVQLTDTCNAKCPQCSMRTSNNFARSTLDAHTVFKIIDAAADKDVKAISFTGGEPLLFLEDLCAYIKRAGERKIPWIRTGTNGFVFAGSHRPGYTDRIARISDTLAATPLRNFWISMDSLAPEIHETMRGFPGIVAGIEKALPVFHTAGIYPSANLGINRNLGGNLTRDLDPRDFMRPHDYETAVYETYCRAFSDFYEFIIGLGFTIVNACYPMSIDPGTHGLEAVYGATTTDAIVRYSAREKAMIFMALNDTIPKFRNRIRIFSPRVSLDALIREYSGNPGVSSPCQGGINYHFIDAGTGNTFPCGFRGQDNLGKFWNLEKNCQKPQPDCRLCDWECYRDPSELAAPLLDLFSQPLKLATASVRNPSHLKLWLSDILYYQACDYFNGRRAPDYPKMRRLFFIRS